jgi:hypothetical protein
MSRKPSRRGRLACPSVRQLGRIPGRRRRGAPTEAGEAAARQHLATCEGCARWAWTMRTAIGVFGTAIRIETPEALRRRIEAVLPGPAPERATGSTTGPDGLAPCPAGGSSATDRHRGA